jgi:hypothetical protein
VNHFGFELVPSFSKEVNNIHCPDPFTLHPIAKSLEEAATHGFQCLEHIAIEGLKSVCPDRTKCSMIPRLAANVRVSTERWTE